MVKLADLYHRETETAPNPVQTQNSSKTTGKTENEPSLTKSKK